MKILTRYVLREHVGPFIAALGVLIGLMLLNQLAKRFGDLVGKGLAWYTIIEVFARSIPFILAMTLPMAVLVAVLYAFSRLAGDNEITAIKAGGVSLTRLMVPVLLGATVIATGMIWFNDTILPDQNHKLRQLLTDISRKRPTFELRERVVNEVVPGVLFLQAAKIDRGRSVLRDMVIFDLGRERAARTIYADSGQMAFNATQTDLYLTLYDGSMHELDTTDPGLGQRTYYEKQVIRVSDVTNQLERGGGSSWRGDREMDVAMMREQVRSRRERAAALIDTTTAVVAALTPRDEPPNGEDASSWQESPKRSGTDTALATEAERTASSDTAGAGEAAGSAETASVRDLRARIAAARRIDWPPRGNAAAFAARARSEFQRLASQLEVQRREMNRYTVEIHKKFSIPVAAIVFVLIGAPIGVRFPRGGIGMVIGVSLAIFCVYYVSLIGGEDLADRGIISPFWAMWAPNVLFAVLGGTVLYLVVHGRVRPGRRTEPTDPDPTRDRRILARSRGPVSAGERG